MVRGPASGGGGGGGGGGEEYGECVESSESGGVCWDSGDDEALGYLGYSQYRYSSCGTEGGGGGPGMGKMGSGIGAGEEEEAEEEEEEVGGSCRSEAGAARGSVRWAMEVGGRREVAALGETSRRGLRQGERAGGGVTLWGGDRRQVAAVGETSMRGLRQGEVIKLDHKGFFIVDSLQGGLGGGGGGVTVGGGGAGGGLVLISVPSGMVVRRYGGGRKKIVVTMRMLTYADVC
jgi:hypothetical protein